MVSCALPFSEYPLVLLAHGGGGTLMHRLIRDIHGFSLDNPYTREGLDAARLRVGGSDIAFTTDSYVISPLFFPGGDIGRLAVTGTVNDLAMVGAKPLFLSLSLIIEEGLETGILEKVVRSVGQAAKDYGVMVVTGDTKVVERGKADKLFINTAGIGVLEHGLKIGPKNLNEGDVLLVSGDIGRHGMSVMSMREGLSFQTDFQSDCAELWSTVSMLLGEGIEPHALRDLTRGGLASALVEFAEQGQVELEIEEAKVPVIDGVRAACEILGIDPLFVANEGCCLIAVSGSDAQRTLELLKGLRVEAAQVGVVTKVHRDELQKAATCSRKCRVVLQTQLGTRRILDLPSGEQLPRIC